ncbi:hypothetical protein ANCCAN_18040 [Ancylostoma caninum]|uniref:Nematode fatty acid retinoid binding protein n=1 Tax=Ancylostoma caninum TaxID=29170 RepID=A0A368FZA0_ANCCA|nr:hypothetical protein ANCCAN_18040 [Ancylostoma caninum]
MYSKVFFTFAVIHAVFAIWPKEIMPGESAALDFIMRVSRLTITDLNYIQNLEFLGKSEDAILEKAKNDDPILYEKMVHFLTKYNKLSEEADKYMNEVFRVAMEQAKWFQSEQYFTPEQIAEAIKVVGKLKDLPVHAELVKMFPDIEAPAPLAGQK